MAAIEYRGLNAVTNFDLSRYIKPPRPNTSSDSNCTTNSNQESGLSFTETTMPSPRPSGGSTSSALGLLLQSSKFKEMLERTSPNDCPSVLSESELPRRSFPDDIQTYFDCQDSSSYVEGDDIIFGDLNTFASPNFHCELIDC